jgi:anti-sigma regulatory factor (Ser/Thr protein kinase)
MSATGVRATLPLSLQPSTARQQLTEMLADRRWDGDAEGAALALHEALVNAERHAGGARRATAGLDGRSLQIEVSDEGPGFTLPEDADRPDGAAERGRGLWLIRQLSSRSEVQRRGREVCLRLRFDR